MASGRRRGDVGPATRRRPAVAAECLRRFGGGPGRGRDTDGARRFRRLRGLGLLLACGLALVPAVAAGQGGGESRPATEDRAAPAVAGKTRQPVPSSGAGPGRQERPPPAAPATSLAGALASERQRAVSRVLECPRDKVARMLELAVEAAENSASIGLEREVLVFCRDRGKVVQELIDGELSLAAVFREDELARKKAAVELEERRRVARAKIEGARQGAAEAAREAEERRLLREEAAAEAAAPQAKRAPVVVVKAPEPKTHERYGWYTIIGSGDDLRAGVTDGSGRWMVRAGDVLPDGGRVTEISGRPPKVLVAGGPPSGLPYRGVR